MDYGTYVLLGSSNLEVGVWTLKSVCWSLEFGCWILHVGIWILEFGTCNLVAGEMACLGWGEPAGVDRGAPPPLESRMGRFKKLSKDPLNLVREINTCECNVLPFAQALSIKIL